MADTNLNPLSPLSPLTYEKFQQIKEKYGSMESWAIWKEGNPNEKPKSGMGDISFFDHPTDEFLKKLKPNIILVGLNISKQISRPFGNFHPDYPQAQDYKLRFALQDTPLWGAYITDIIKDFEQKVSGELMSYLGKNPAFVDQNIEFFKRELDFIGAKNPVLIALGRDAEKILSRNLIKEFRIFIVPHYSHFISKEDLREAFQNILPDIS